MKLTEKRFNQHTKFMDIVQSNCKYLKNYPEWTYIYSEYDEGAFKIEGGTIYVSINGTDDVKEVLNNFKAKAPHGEHEGFAESGEALFYHLFSSINADDLFNCDFELDGRSRGGALVQIIAKLLRRAGVTESINVATTGTAPLLTEGKLEGYKEEEYYTHSMVVTKRDFIPRLQGPKTRIGKWFFKLFGLERLYHYYTEKVVFNNVKGKIDHINYKIAGEKYDWEE